MNTEQSVIIGSCPILGEDQYTTDPYQTYRGVSQHYGRLGIRPQNGTLNSKGPNGAKKRITREIEPICANCPLNVNNPDCIPVPTDIDGIGVVCNGPEVVGAEIDPNRATAYIFPEADLVEFIEP